MDFLKEAETILLPWLHTLVPVSTRMPFFHLNMYKGMRVDVHIPKFACVSFPDFLKKNFPF